MAIVSLACSIQSQKPWISSSSQNHVVQSSAKLLIPKPFSAVACFSSHHSKFVFLN